MCGIVGLLHKDPHEPVDRRLLEAMTDSLAHRGPDDRGVFIDGPVGLGHRRLSVIDLEAGQQPMSSSTGRTWIVYNGEIYNYRELQRELVADGVQLRTQSDTEVLLALYEREGASFVERLNGMFAFAIYDRGSRSLIVARDRLGIKPLYVWNGPRCWVLASEIKAILVHPDAPRRVRPGVLGEYLQFRQLDSVRTMFEGIDSIEPATLRSYGGEKLETSARYWRLPEVVPATETHASPGWNPKQMASLVEDAVRLNLIADVPVGTFNGGGVDSSLVTAIARKAHDGPLDTFAVGFDESGYDERPYARIVAHQLGVQCHELVMDATTFAAELEPSIHFHDEPLNHPNSTPIRLLARHAKQRATVVLTGEGADELFGGYPRYRLILAVAALKRAGRWVPRVLEPLLRGVPGRKARLIASTLGRSDAWVLASNARYMLDEPVRALCDEDPLQRRVDRAARSENPLQAVLAFELDHYLHNVLARMDRMTMASGLEARVPLLDHRLVEFAASIPLRAKMPGWRTKVAIKDLAQDWLPSSIIDRKKSGFGVPLDSWMRQRASLAPHVESLLEARTLQRGWWRPAAVRALVEEHRRGQDRSEVLWSMINLELWARLRLDLPVKAKHVAASEV